MRIAYFVFRMSYVVLRCADSIIDNYLGCFVGGSGKGSGTVRVVLPVVP